MYWGTVKYKGQDVAETLVQNGVAKIRMTPSKYETIVMI